MLFRFVKICLYDLNDPVSDLGRARCISIVHILRTGCGAHADFFQWFPEALSPGVKQPGHEADSYLHLSLRLGMSGAVPVIPVCASPHGWGQSYLHSFFCLTSLYRVTIKEIDTFNVM